MTVLITLTTYGSDTGPFFNLYSNIDGYVTAFETGVAKADLIAGYVCTTVPDFATTIRVQSTGECTNYVDIAVEPTTTTSTTTATGVGTCYNIFLPVAQANNGVDDLYITYTPVGGALTDAVYTSLDDTGAYSPDYEFNLCSETEPLFKYGVAGGYESIVEIIVTEGGSCTENGDCIV